jgi:VanZ family protein
MGAIDEFVQSFFPYRTASVTDWLVDVGAGTLAAAALRASWPRAGDPE